MFYGTAYVTGPVAVFGPIDNLSIEANVTSNKGTKIHIPLDGATEVATQDYIQFVSKMAHRQYNRECLSIRSPGARSPEGSKWISTST
jgi:hypothetical protein